MEKFREFGWDRVTANREASWNSVHDIFIRVLEAEDPRLHYDIPGKPWVDKDPDLFKTFEDMEAYDRDPAARTRSVLDALSTQSLDRDVVFEGSKGRRRPTIEDILIHTFVDELAHLEPICLMRQQDTEPPYIPWLRLHPRTA